MIQPVTKQISIYTLGRQVPIRNFVVDQIKCFVYKSPAVGYVVIGNNLDARGLDRKDFLVRIEDGWYTLRDAGPDVPTLYRALHFHDVSDAETYIREATAWEKLG